MNYEYFNIGIQIREKIFDLILLDINGRLTFLDFPLIILKSCHCVIIVYDITDRESFDNLKIWIDICNNYCEQNIIRVLVGNKCEQEDKRKVSYEEGKKFAEKHNLKFYEATYITGKNINNIFFYPTYQIYEKIKKGEYEIENVKVNHAEQKNCIII